MVKKLFSLCKVHRLVHVARVKWSAIVYRDMQCTENVYRIVQKDEVSFITSMKDGQLRSSMYEQNYGTIALRDIKIFMENSISIQDFV